MFFCRVLAIHEAELIGYEMGLWTVAQPLLGDCLRTWGFSDGGANSVLMTTHFYDRKHMFNEVEARSPSRHGPIVQHLEAQVQSRFPAARFERTWISREHPWFSKADRGAAHAKHFTQRNRPIWLHQLYGAIGDVQPLLFYFTYVPRLAPSLCATTADFHGASGGHMGRQHTYSSSSDAHVWQ